MGTCDSRDQIADKAFKKLNNKHKKVRQKKNKSNPFAQSPSNGINSTTKSLKTSSSFSQSSTTKSSTTL